MDNEIGDCFSLLRSFSVDCRTPVLSRLAQYWVELKAQMVVLYFCCEAFYPAVILGW
jgi:hypothetical protein